MAWAASSICFWISTRLLPLHVPSAPITCVLNLAFSSSRTGLQLAHTLVCLWEYLTSDLALVRLVLYVNADTEEMSPCAAWTIRHSPNCENLPFLLQASCVKAFSFRSSLAHIGKRLQFNSHHLATSKSESIPYRCGPFCLLHLLVLVHD